MKIGIDLRVLQVGHQYRGIGAHLIHLFQELANMDNVPQLVLFEHPNVESGTQYIKPYLKNLDYEIRHTDIRLVGETYLQREWTSFKQRVLRGDAGFGKLEDIDVLLCIDFNLGVPKRKFAKSVLVTYDLIPWVLSEFYLPNFLQSYRQHKNIKRCLKAEIDKWLYFTKILQANKRAEKIVSISEHTKQDIADILHIPVGKVKTIPLGSPNMQKSKLLYDVSVPCITADEKNKNLETNSTGYVFYMGGADRRRHIEDLIQAHGLCRKAGDDIVLVLAGYDFSSLDTVPDEITKMAIEQSEYKEDIYFAGFITENNRNALFRDAIAFIFPSIYEGFGLPILEAMQFDCPVITYNNSSIMEVGGDAVVYVNTSKEMAKNIEILARSKGIRNSYIKKFPHQLKKFSWRKCAEETLTLLSEVAR